jgi:hypothetical protein
MKNSFLYLTTVLVVAIIAITVINVSIIGKVESSANLNLGSIEAFSDNETCNYVNGKHMETTTNTVTIDNEKGTVTVITQTTKCCKTETDSACNASAELNCVH